MLNIEKINMQKLDANLLDYMGNTPIVKLQKINAANNHLFIKLEEFNPGGSIKSRIALNMILAAEKLGVLIPNSQQTILEPTGGNTGIGLAMVGAIRGYQVILVVPDNFSKEKVRMLKAYGAKVILSDSSTGPGSHVRKADELIKQHPEYLMLNQFVNPANPNAHYIATAQEIIAKIKHVDYFVAGIGSGGTISGVGKALKQEFPDVKIVGVEPKGCNALKGLAIPHKIQALSIGILPKTLNTEIVNEMIAVTYEEAVDCMKNLATQEGLLVGISSGANVCAALKLANEVGQNKTIVTIAPDSGRSYLDVFNEQCE
jgi:cysteine synthase A